MTYYDAPNQQAVQQGPEPETPAEPEPEPDIAEPAPEHKGRRKG